MKNKIVISIILIITWFISIYFIKLNQKEYCQIVEKGQYHRLQYETIGGNLIPDFKIGYYYILRNENGEETDKILISENECNTYVLGDTLKK